MGAESVREIVTTTCELKIPYLTLYAFSKENWARPQTEVRTLLKFLSTYLKNELPLMMDKGIRFNVIGEIEDFPKKLQEEIRSVVNKTTRNKNLCLNLAMSYSGRREIVHAVKGMVRDATKGVLKKIDERAFKKYLYTGAIPDPDLLIRTSGEMRISNFLLWQIAYTEIYVTEIFWPDFRKKAYLEALREFTRRERRFGKVKES